MKLSAVIDEVKARKILDSRANWTIEVEVVTSNSTGRCSAPSGASTGKFEAVPFPENSVDKALAELRNIVAPKLKGVAVDEQDNIDKILKEIDGTQNFSRIGGNTAVAVSVAAARAAAVSQGVPLYRYLGGGKNSRMPFPLANVVGGGMHANTSMDIQELLVIPLGAKTIEEALDLSSEVYRRAKKKLEKKGVFGKGDEGAWAPDMKDEEALDVLYSVCSDVSDETGKKIVLGMDVAASVLWNSTRRKYVYRGEGVSRSVGEQIDYIKELIERYSLYYVEDPIEENDFDGFAELTKRVNCMVCGDDLYVTNAERIRKGINKASTNTVLIKPNQCGTLTDTFEAVDIARKNRQATVVSHRSGETADDFIAHIAVATGSSLIKTGIAGGERTAKLNELIRIGEELKIKMAELQ